MGVLISILKILLIALSIESISSLIKWILKWFVQIDDLGYIISIIVGIVLCVWAGTGFISILIGKSILVDSIMSGVVISRISNVINDVLYWLWRKCKLEV